MARPSSRAPSPPEAYDALVTELAGVERLERLVVVRGDEPYFVRRCCDAVVARAGELDYEVLVRDGADPDSSLDEVLGELATPPMFAPRQLLLLRGFDKELSGSGRSEGPPLVAALLRFLARDEPDRAVLLVGKGLRADHKLAKAAARLVGLRKLYDNPPPWKPDPSATELVQWVRRRAKELGLALAPRDALLVAAATGNDLDAIDVQLERVRASGRPVAEAIAWQAGGTPWDTADQLLGGDPARAVSAVVSLFGGGMVEKDGKRVVDPAALSVMVLNALARGARQGLVIAEARAAGESKERAFELGGAKGHAEKTWLPRMQARPYPHQWRELLEDVGELERASRGETTLDVDGFVALALRWNRARGRATGDRRAPAHGGAR